MSNHPTTHPPCTHPDVMDPTTIPVNYTVRGYLYDTQYGHVICSKCHKPFYFYRYIQTRLGPLTNWTLWNAFAECMHTHYVVIDIPAKRGFCPVCRHSRLRLKWSPISGLWSIHPPKEWVLEEAQEAHPFLHTHQTLDPKQMLFSKS